MEQRMTYSLVAMRSAVFAILVSILLVGCRHLPSERASGHALEGADPVFAHLLSRYDRDGDGVVVVAEYRRGPEAFARLDRDGDGRLTVGDFAAEGRRLRAMAPKEIRRLRAVHLIAWYFQDDAEPDQVTADELERSFTAFDRDRDGRIGRSEFERNAKERAARGRRPAGEHLGLLEVETTDPWERTLLGVDENDDGFLTLGELRAFHADNADNGGAWAFEDAGLPAATVSLAGREAPDFTLARQDGSGTATLSSFAGDRPVALIFGSWT
jgi:Ca2+-binding EF-hand superfamily protein